MAKITNRTLDAVRKLEIVTITDVYGAKQILQHPITLDGYNKEAKEAEVLAEMNDNERKFRERTGG